MYYWPTGVFSSFLDEAGVNLILFKSAIDNLDLLGKALLSIGAAMFAGAAFAGGENLSRRAPVG